MITIIVWGVIIAIISITRSIAIFNAIVVASIASFTAIIFTMITIITLINSSSSHPPRRHRMKGTTGT